MLAVDFFAVGDTIKVVNTFNAAVSDVLGVTAFWNNTIAAAENDVTASLADRADAGRVDRLPPSPTRRRSPCSVNPSSTVSNSRTD